MPEPAGRATVLILDDELYIVEEIVEYLHAERIWAEGYTDSALALRRILERPGFTHAVVDIRMPGIDGFSVINSLTRLPEPKPKIIAMSGHATQQDRDKALQTGADCFLAKPFDLPSLTAIIDGSANIS